MKKFNKTRLSQIVHTTLTISKKSIVVFTLFAMISTQVNAKNWLEKTMADSLGGLSNTTTPKAFHTSTRGVVSGGSVQMRNKIFNNQLISFVPPSFNASCNGMDVFLGSFSFINADELIQLFRSIASNALGFLFHLALSVVSEKISQIMQKFSDIVREINKLVSDSCHMGKGIVNLALDRDKSGNAYQELRQTTSSIWNKTKSLGGDFETLFNFNQGKSSPEANADGTNVEERKNEGEVGNLMYLAMKKNLKNGTNRSFASRLKNSGYDENEVEELAMSLAGVFISTPSKTTTTAGAHGASVEDNYEIEDQDGVLSLKQLVEGSEAGDFTVYKCSGDDCLTPYTKTLDDQKGFAQHLYKLICNEDKLSTPCSLTSPISALANNNQSTGTGFTDAQMNALFLLPNQYRDQITKLQILTGGATKMNVVSEAGQLVQQNIHLLGLNMAREFAEEIFTELDKQVSAYKGSSKAKLKEKIEKRKIDLYNEFMALTKDPTYGDVNSMLQDLNRRVKTWESIPNASARNIDPNTSGALTD